MSQIGLIHDDKRETEGWHDVIVSLTNEPREYCKALSLFSQQLLQYKPFGSGICKTREILPRCTSLCREFLPSLHPRDSKLALDLGMHEDDQMLNIKSIKSSCQPGWRFHFVENAVQPTGLSIFPLQYVFSVSLAVTRTQRVVLNFLRVKLSRTFLPLIRHNSCCKDKWFWQPRSYPTRLKFQFYQRYDLLCHL